MKKRLAILITVELLFHSPTSLFAQTNSWTNATSGNWEDSYWSLGVLPGTNQTILLANEGVKVLTMGANTAENFPETMNVDSITISSPPNSGNILLLNYAGFDTPLTAEQITIGSNSTMLAYSSSIQVTGSGLLQIDGTFIQDEGAQVLTEWVYIDGTYNLISGRLTAGSVEGIDAFGKFIQSGGTNASPIALNVSGFGTPDSGEAPEYDLNGGEFDGEILIRNNGTFNQSGGIANDTSKVNVLGLGYYGIDGHLIQSGGIFNGPTNSPLYIPAYDPEGFVHEIPTGSSAMQTGGTNQEYNLAIGLPLPAEIYASYNNPLQYNNCGGTPDYGGTYSLSNGVLITSGTSITANGAIEQSGGVDIVNGTLSLQGTLYYTFTVTAPYYNDVWFVGCVKAATYSLRGGLLSESNLAVEGAGSLFQSGGTNTITGSLALSDPNSLQSQLDGKYVGNYELSGGLLIASNISIGYGEFLQSSGRLVVGNLSGLNFTQTGGNITQSGLLTFGLRMQVAPGIQQFGQLLLGSYYTYPSLLTLPTDSCLIQFADSSAIAWPSNGENLMIQNWSGSHYGGGSQQIVFGSNSAALTPQQVSQIQFQNPAGLVAGTYPARILPTGEIVPDTGAQLPLKMQISGALSNGAMPLQVQGDIGQSYEVDVSTDLINWTLWTNLSNSNGSIFLSDSNASSFPQRFYRAMLVP